MEEYVRVSDISSYLKCPRTVYYASQGHRPVKTVSASYAAALLVKEMARSYADLIECEDIGAVLEGLLQTAAQNLTVIYRQELQSMDEEMLSEAVEMVSSWFEDMQCGISDSIEMFGAGRLTDLTTSHTSEPVLYSERFRMSGSPDKLVMIGDEVFPSIIRTGYLPQSGIWKDDRIRITALAILVEEELNCVVELGIVEYARWGIVREVKIKRTDRRKVLALGGKVRKIKSGRLPTRPDGAPCEYCGYTSFCDVTPTLATKFF